MSKDRCLVRLEELTLENELLLKDNEVLKNENSSLKKVIKDMGQENKEYRGKLDRCQVALGGEDGE